MSAEVPAGALEAVANAVRATAIREIMPRYLKVARRRKHDGSLFTEADVAAQAALEAVLRDIVDVPVLGEEMPRSLQENCWEGGREGLWCIDPIDGTSNFVNGLPYFAVSVALMRAGRTVLGVVYDPIADEMFWAARGEGAHLNGERLPIKNYVPELSGAMAGVDFKRLPVAISAELAAHPPYASQRNYGASTLDWCYVAAGRFDVYAHGGQKLWDYAAGALILEEAGGHMSTLDGKDFWAAGPWQRSVIAALDPALFSAWGIWLRAANQARV